MKKRAIDKTIKVKINLQFPDLSRLGIVPDDLIKILESLVEMFSCKYERMFPSKISDKDVDRIVRIHNVLNEIKFFQGFSRHLRLYDKNTIEDHLLSAQAAAWLTKLGNVVELEPPTPGDSRGPDLKCESEKFGEVFFECKRIYTGKFYDEKFKEGIADLIISVVPKNSMLNIDLMRGFSIERTAKILKSVKFRNDVMNFIIPERINSLSIDGQFSCSLHRNAVTCSAGMEEMFEDSTLILRGWQIDQRTNVRLPGYSFTKSGRSVSVHGPPPDYRPIWGRKRRKSKGQQIADRPFVVLMSDHDVLGDPKDHERFFEEVWLTEENSGVSGIGFVSFSSNQGKESVSQFKYYPNPHASSPLSQNFFDASAPVSG